MNGASQELLIEQFIAIRVLEERLKTSIHSNVTDHSVQIQLSSMQSIIIDEFEPILRTYEQFYKPGSQNTLASETHSS